MVEIFMHSEKKAAKLEVNALFSPKYYDPSLSVERMLGDDFKVIAPAHGSRTEPKSFEVMLNGEVMANFETFFAKGSKSDFIIEGNNFIFVPIKTSCIAFVPSDASKLARIYFRTPQDAKNYKDKVLTMPGDSSGPDGSMHPLALNCDKNQIKKSVTNF